VTDKEIEYNVTPQFLALNKYFKGAGARLSASKDLDRSSRIEAYADLLAASPKGGEAFVKPQKIGLEYRKTFAKGGSVSASKRADGIAQRGKTKGRMV